MTIKLVLKNEANGSEETTLLLDDLLITIGNSAGATIRLESARIAPEQAVIINENDRPLFINQAKRTFYNGQELEQGVRREITNGDKIEIGNFSLTAYLNDAERMSETRTGEEAFAGQILNGNEPNALVSKSPENTGLQSFADILTSLRKEEDQFYFQLLSESGQQKERIPIQTEEMALGWNSEDGGFTSNKEHITEPRAVVRKDWSGVTIYPQGDEPSFINGALLEAGQRLRNGDRLGFSRKLSQATSEEVALIFCEPAALVELNSILPQQLLTTALETSRAPAFVTANQTAQIVESGQTAVAPRAEKSQTKTKRYFGFFTLAEILIMIVATIFTAALTFLLLELL